MVIVLGEAIFQYRACGRALPAELNESRNVSQ